MYHVNFAGEPMMVCCFGFNGPFQTVFQSISGRLPEREREREREKTQKRQHREDKKMSKHPHPHLLQVQ